MKSFNEFRKKLLENPAVAKEYEKIDPRFQVAKELIRLRTKRGVTQKELALRIESTQAVISRIESGSVNCSMDTIQRIADALDGKIIIQIEPVEVFQFMKEFVIEPIGMKSQNENEAKRTHQQKGKGIITSHTDTYGASIEWVVNNESSETKTRKSICLS